MRKNQKFYFVCYLGKNPQSERRYGVMVKVYNHRALPIEVEKYVSFRLITKNMTRDDAFALAESCNLQHRPIGELPTVAFNGVNERVPFDSVPPNRCHDFALTAMT